MPEEPEENPRDRHIISIAPAVAGWRAVLSDVDDEKRVLAFPVLCWALIRRPYAEDGAKGVDTYVAPMIAEVRANNPSGTVVASDFGSFIGVAAPGEDPAEILARHQHVEMVEKASVMPSAGEA